MNTHTPSSITLYRVTHDSMKSTHVINYTQATDRSCIDGGDDGARRSPQWAYCHIIPVHATTGPKSLQLARIIVLSISGMLVSGEKPPNESEENLSKWLRPIKYPTRNGLVSNPSLRSDGPDTPREWRHGPQNYQLTKIRVRNEWSSTSNIP